MKKVFVVIFAAAMAMQSFATTRNAEADFELKMNMKEVKEVLVADMEQADILKEATRDMKRKIARLAKVSPEKRQARLTEAVFCHLGTVRPYLSEIQYRKYLTLLNREFNENHLNGIMFGYDLAEE